MNWKKIKQSSVALMFIIIVSKIIGMFREIILANYFGTTNISDAYLIASSVPVLLFYFIGHSLSTAYIPMYNKVKVEKGEVEAHRYSNNLLSISLVLSTLIVLLLLLFPNFVVKLFAAGFDMETTQIAVRLIRISAPSIYLMSIVHICSGYLNANKSFLAPASISLPRNAAIVVSIVLAASIGTDWLGWGLLASYILEFLFLMPFVFKMGYRYKPLIDLKDENLKQTLYIVTPILVGMCVGQVNKIIDKSMASMVIEGGISALTYASIINSAVQEVLVTGIITILFTSISELSAKGEHEQIKNKLLSTINTMVFLLVPASVGVIVLAEPLVSVILLRGNFDENSLAMTVGALRFYTFGLLFLAIRDTLVKVFYAYKQTKITTFTSIMAILINIVLNIILSKVMGLNGLAIATSASAVFNCIVLYILLRKKNGDLGTEKIIMVLVKSVIGSAVMGVTVHLINAYLSKQVNEIAAFIVSVIGGCIVYFIVEIILNNKPVIKSEKQY